MTDSITLTHDVAVEAFDSAHGPVSTDDDGVTFSWDEEHIVRVDAPADLQGAFDTDRFYKVEDATVARPIKQPYMVGDEVKLYKKPAEELSKAAWTFDNAPYSIPHPDSGMVKDVNDIHGFWRNVRYDSDSERMLADLYIPSNDDYALEFIEEHQDVSPGFYNRVVSEYDGETGDLTDEDGLDGYQVDMYGDHIAGVEHGRCSGSDGCGLDDRPHGDVINVDTTVTMSDNDHDRDYVIAPPTTDYRDEDDRYFAVSPNENPDDEPKYPINNCSDVQDAWKLRGHGDLSISQESLEERIKRRARDLDCSVPGTDETSDSVDCDCTDNTMSDNDNTDGFDIPDLSIDALTEKNDAVQELKEERDTLREYLDEAEEAVLSAFDAADNFSVELEEDEQPFDAVEDLIEDLDEKVAEVERLSDELTEYREEEIEDRLDTLDELGADRDEWEDEADEASDPIDVLDEEIERREEVLDAMDVDTSVKNVQDSGPEGESSDEGDNRTMHGGRSFERGHGA